MMAPKFSWRFFLPKYWLVWIGAAILYIITWLPYPVIKLLGRGVGKLIGLLASKRVNVARRNFELVYPDWTPEQREQLVKDNLFRTGMALFETAMGWWWPTWRVRRIGEVEGLDHALKVLKSGKGVFGLVIHNVNIEICCRIIGLAHPCVAFYRKHNNPLLDYMQYHGRNRSNKYMIHKRNAKALIRALDEGEIGLYFPDQDYGKNQSVFVPFGAVEKTATTTGTLMFANRANCIPMFITPQYSEKGYKVKISAPLPYLADNQAEAALTALNKDIFALVNEQPDGYLWMHKRFKTRPDDEPASLY
ncbi:LpxL/LpxP family Kdo(2)-lipid IV(A) lauroyl/palmitoleoyl acyltransferase [Glaciecola sp. MH2013]|uniref:LpxL/LpxP family Kdo(2)-lipid IV(A) lauroyl/palmitoleoyl acyltransferase n=1 Tax=Glaciecola sp. MH2013 TaxID=2785524 RepID=UPI00189EC52A|nr:LpxL/LpxP family Kdo(2)-lipid IV(A) lauroyl/palmitoleoyl acyltransferase [Glaciecola sp. MH2013]MBF7072139.1 LpxL/LpxP family Kdo(2)-lipid IV(A) lauroyl/palmitoleoyl acyltransferase [Glaciecola sp. MH2013]